MTKIIVFTFLFFAPCIFVSQNLLDEIVEFYKKDKDLQHASFGFCILDATTGKTIKEYNSDLALIPASTLKIVTTSAALGILGRDFTYKTNFYTFQKKDSVSGLNNYHLLVKGSGDPSFNSSYFYHNDSVFYTSMIQKLKTKGLKKITGSIIIDASYFDNSIPSTWIWADIGNYFGAGANGLSYHDNKFSILYNSGNNNTIAEIESIYPDYFSKKMSISSNVLSAGTEDDAFVYGDPSGYSRKITGTIPPNKKKYEIEAEMPEPALFFATQLQTELTKNNLVTSNLKLVTNEIPSTYSENYGQLIYTHTSPRLEKIVYYTNQKSNNHYAESLLKTIGATKVGKQGTTENGIKAIENYWKDRGVDVSGLHMADGSGLSRANTITTKIQAIILSKIYRDSLIYKPFNASLPIAGKNGSMSNLCKGTFAENNMRAKTGYINSCLLYTSPSPRDRQKSRMPSSA